MKLATVMIGFCLCMGNLAAASVQFVFAGAIESAPSPFVIGTAFNGSMVFNDSQAGSSTINGQDYQYSQLTLNVGGDFLSFGPLVFEVDNDGSFAGDRVDMEFGAGTLGGLAFTHGRVRLANAANTAITTNALPFNTVLSDWTNTELWFYGDSFDVIGQLQTASITAIPESGTWAAIVGAAIFAVVVILRRRGSFSLQPPPL